MTIHSRYTIPSAWPHPHPDAEDVHSAWCSLRSSAAPDQFFDRRSKRLWQRRQHCDQSARLFLFASRFGERDVYLHTDNCSSQIKNNCMMQHLVWCTITNRHTNITLSFLPVGHTKCAPDWCFGLFKHSYRRKRVGSLLAIAQVINSSADCNYSQLELHKDGSTIVPMYNWTDFFPLPRLKKISGIKKFHHFRMSSSSPGLVFAKQWSDSPEVTFLLFKEPWTPAVDELPAVGPQRGLSTERQWYLYDSIHQFCPDNDTDIVCPLSFVPKTLRQ